jgi:ATP-dependent DNA helicase RecG
VIREVVGNALVHRDYSIAGTDIMLAIYADRLEIQSPGRLPNTVTPEGMKSGMR